MNVIPWRATSIIGALVLLSVAGCAGPGPGCGSGCPPSPAVSVAPVAPATVAVAAGQNASIPLPGRGLLSQLTLQTANSWPNGVSATSVFVSTAFGNNAPPPESISRRTQSDAGAIGAWEITFSGATGTDALTSPPTATYGGSPQTNAAPLVVELFDATAGGAPLLFFWNSSSNEYVAQGSTFQITLSDTYYLEIVAGSTYAP